MMTFLFEIHPQKISRFHFGFSHEARRNFERIICYYKIIAFCKSYKSFEDRADRFTVDIPPGLRSSLKIYNLLFMRTLFAFILFSACWRYLHIEHFLFSYFHRLCTLFKTPAIKLSKNASLRIFASYCLFNKIFVRYIRRMLKFVCENEDGTWWALCLYNDMDAVDLVKKIQEKNAQIAE